MVIEDYEVKTAFFSFSFSIAFDGGMRIGSAKGSNLK